MIFIESKAGCGANIVVVGGFDVGSVSIPVVLVLVANMASICGIMWVARSTPPLLLGW